MHWSASFLADFLTFTEFRVQRRKWCHPQWAQLPYADWQSGKSPIDKATDLSDLGNSSLRLCPGVISEQLTLTSRAPKSAGHLLGTGFKASMAPHGIRVAHELTAAWHSWATSHHYFLLPTPAPTRLWFGLLQPIRPTVRTFTPSSGSRRDEALTPGPSWPCSLCHLPAVSTAIFHYLSPFLKREQKFHLSKAGGSC